VFKLNRFALYFWGVFCPIILSGALLALICDLFFRNFGQLQWLVFLPLPHHIVLLYLLSGMLSLLLFGFVFLPISQKLDLALLNSLKRLSSREDAARQISLNPNVKRHYLINAIADYIQTLQRRENRLLALTKKDFLTTFETQKGSEVRLNDLLSQHDMSFDVIAVRINNLRVINDMYGFHNGDNCIKAIADRLSMMPGHGVRMDSGDLLWLSSAKLKRSTVREITKSLVQPVSSSGMSITLDVRVGIIECPSEADNSEALFRRVWLTLEEASRYRQVFRQYNSKLDQSYLRRLLIISELEAVFNGRESELALYYQPKINLISGKVEAAEALIRWHNPVLGQVSPDEFITLATQTGLLSKLSFWVISQAVKDLIDFRQRNIPIKIAVNVSAEDIADKKLLDHAVGSLSKAGLSPSLLSFELTESQLVENPDRAIASLEAFRNHGFKVAVDDFGTGYSSLAYLKRLPVDELKIDKSFVLQLDSQPEDQSIVQTILTLAERFNLSVVAEGVEVSQSLSLLRQWGCHWAQGYLVSRPLPKCQFIEWFLSPASVTWQKTCFQALSVGGTPQVANLQVSRDQSLNGSSAE